MIDQTQAHFHHKPILHSPKTVPLFAQICPQFMPMALGRFMVYSVYKMRRHAYVVVLGGGVGYNTLFSMLIKGTSFVSWYPKNLGQVFGL